VQVQLYKPNSKNTGAAVSFSIGSVKDSSEPAFFINVIQQSSWDDVKKVGSFSANKSNPAKNISVKMGEFELGEIINAFNKEISWSGFHSNSENKTQIRFGPFDKVRGKDANAVNYKAFGLSFTRNGSDNFKVSIEPGEMIRIVNLFYAYFNLLNNTRAKAHEKRRLERGSVNKSVPSTPEAVPQAEDDDNPSF
jgi:hypothetical protein